MAVCIAEVVVAVLLWRDATTAVFVALGQRVVFVPAPGNEPVSVCR